MKQKNPFDGFKDFDDCARRMSKRVGVYSPKGLCATIARRRNPVAEIIQTRKLSEGRFAVEYVDVDDHGKFHGVIAAPGIRLLLNDPKFSIMYAVFVKSGHKWKWLASTDTLSGSYDLDRGEVTFPDDFSGQQYGQLLVKPALALFEWLALEKAEHGSLRAVVGRPVP